MTLAYLKRSIKHDKKAMEYLGIFQEAGVVSHVDVPLVHAPPGRWMPSWVRWSWLWLALEASALDVTRP